MSLTNNTLKTSVCSVFETVVSEWFTLLIAMLKRHCNTEFIKQELPTLLNPLGTSVLFCCLGLLTDFIVALSGLFFVSVSTLAPLVFASVSWTILFASGYLLLSLGLLVLRIFCHLHFFNGYISCLGQYCRISLSEA